MFLNVTFQILPALFHVLDSLRFIEPRIYFNYLYREYYDARGRLASKRPASFHSDERTIRLFDRSRRIFQTLPQSTETGRVKRISGRNRIGPCYASTSGLHAIPYGFHAAYMKRNRCIILIQCWINLRRVAVNCRNIFIKRLTNNNETHTLYIRREFDSERIF